MRRLGLSACVLASACWAQVNPIRVEVATPVSVRVEASPTPPWLSLLQPAAPAIGAAAALLGVFLTNLFSRKNSRLQHQREMMKWRADKQLEVLSRIGQLLVQTRHALEVHEERGRRAVQLREVRAALAEINAADEEARKARQELEAKLEELAALSGSAGFALSDKLWVKLQTVEGTFVDVRTKELGPNDRPPQLTELDKLISEVIADVRSEVESLRHPSG